MADGQQDGGHRGLRAAAQVGAAVQELGGGDALGDEAHEAEFDVAGPQDGAGDGELEADGRHVERVLAGPQRADAGSEFLVVRLADPLGVERPGCIAHGHREIMS